MADPAATVDLEIHISAPEGAARYAVEIIADYHQRVAQGSLQPERLTAELGAASMREVLSPLLAAQDAADRLYRWLFSDPALERAWADLRGRNPDRRLRFTIDPEAPELHALTWELLREPIPGGRYRYLAADNESCFSRFVALPYPAGTPVLDRPLRILAAIADPLDPTPKQQWKLAPIPVAQELEMLRKVTEGLPVQVVELPRPWTLADLELELRRGYHALHFVGHGAFIEETGDGVLYLADAQNHVRPAPAKEIADLMERILPAGGPEGASLRLVFLMSCETARSDTASAFRGVAAALVAAGVPAVLAMQDLVPMATAHAFARTFYQRLLDHGRVDLAVNEGRSTLITGAFPGCRLPAYAIPCLYMRLADGRLLEPDPGTLVPPRFGPVVSAAGLPPAHLPAAFPEDSLAMLCDRVEQWAQLEPRGASGSDELVFLPGQLQQGHSFFGRRVYRTWSALQREDWLTVALLARLDCDARLEHLCERLEERLAWPHDTRTKPSVRLVECLVACGERLQRRVIALVHERLPLGPELEQEESVVELWKYYRAIAEAVQQAGARLGEGRRPVVKCLHPVGWPRASWFRRLLMRLSLARSERRRIDASLERYRQAHPAPLWSPAAGQRGTGPAWLPELQAIGAEDVRRLYLASQAEYHLVQGREEAFVEEVTCDAADSDAILRRIDELKDKYVAR